MDTKELRALCEAATPGPWRTYDSGGGIDVEADSGYFIAEVHDNNGKPENKANARLIAALSPARVLRMIDALEKAEEALGLARDYVNAAYVERSQLYASYPHRWATEREDLSKVDAARASIQALKEETP